MQYRLSLPDLSVHSELTCGGPGHCTISNSRASWDLAYPLWRMAPTELDAARAVKQRFPDSFPMPVPSRIPGEDPSIMLVVFENEEEVKRMQLLKGQVNPVCIVELVPENRVDRKLIKKKGALDKHLWFSGYVPALESVNFERKLAMRSSLRLGPTTLPVQVGKNVDGSWELQIPGALSIVMTDEFVEQLSMLKR